MTVFDVFDKGLSQTRGLTLYELVRAQIKKLKYLSKKEMRRKKAVKDNPTENGSIKEDNDFQLKEDFLLMDEIPANLEEALCCLDHEFPNSHAGKVRKKLLIMKHDLLN